MELLRRLRSGVERRARMASGDAAGGLRLPCFLGIGAARAGTTWLWACLRRHPDLYLPEKKELHHWDQHFHASLESYARWFEEAGSRLPGEVTPGYSVLPRERIRYMRRLMPDVRLILLLRNPVERAWSAMLRRKVKIEGRRLEEIPPAEIRAHLTADQSRSRGDYETILDNWLAIYPEEQLFIGFFEEIGADPEGLMSRIFRHAGVEPPSDWNGYPLAERANRSADAAFPEEYRMLLREMYRPAMERLAARLGPPAAAWLERES